METEATGPQHKHNILQSLPTSRGILALTITATETSNYATQQQMESGVVMTACFHCLDTRLLACLRYELLIVA